ncbi:MAG: PaREP1 family protein [Acidilobaceae archaeon]|jgi:histone H3/H4
MDEGSVDSMIALAEEVLGYAEEEFRKALEAKDILLYRNAADKAFLALVIAVNGFIVLRTSAIPLSHSDRRKFLRELGREDLRAIYSDLMRTLHDEAFYERVYDPEEVKYAIKKVRNVIEEIKKAISRRAH